MAAMMGKATQASALALNLRWEAIHAVSDLSLL